MDVLYSNINFKVYFFRFICFYIYGLALFPTRFSQRSSAAMKHNRKIPSSNRLKSY